MKRLRHLLEGAALWVALGLFRLLPIERASALGGRLGRLAGRMSPKSRTARRNLRAAFPAMTDGEIERTIAGMWDNLGRFLAEMPHIHELDVYGGDRVDIVLAPEVERLLDERRPAIYFTAHFGNWEVSPLAAVQRGIDLTLVYRVASNPWSERLIQRWREKRGGRWARKGREGARALIAGLSSDGSLAILADQKMNEGLPVPFFGREAMTATAIAELALKFDVPLVPARVERLPRARFRIVVPPPLAVPRTGDKQTDVFAILSAINRLFEDWIRERPDHWLWIHRRWGE